MFLRNINGQGAYHIYDMAGVKIQSGYGNISNGIDITGLKAGIYIFQLQFERNVFNLTFNVSD